MTYFKLAEIRELYNLSQRDVAKKMNISKSTYARWETLEQYIPLKHLNDFCNIFNCSMDYIVGLSQKNSKMTKLNSLSFEQIGKNLKQIKKSNNLTQSKLACYLNTSQSTIGTYESGRTIILTIFALELCKKYNISLDWLCGKSNKMNLEIE